MTRHWNTSAGEELSIEEIMQQFQKAQLEFVATKD
jgi:hypothetical protein